jgi:hypothetical protein
MWRKLLLVLGGLILSALREKLTPTSGSPSPGTAGASKLSPRYWSWSSNPKTAKSGRRSERIPTTSRQTALPSPSKLKAPLGGTTALLQLPWAAWSQLLLCGVDSLTLVGCANGPELGFTLDLAQGPRLVLGFQAKPVASVTHSAQTNATTALQSASTGN